MANSRYNYAMKQCTKCNKVKEEDQFYTRADNGLKASDCKSCKIIYKNSNYNKNKYKPKQRYKHLLNAAKTRNLEITITELEHSELIKRNCYYCDQDISKETGGGLDRLNNNLGYMITNVVTCCGKCNFGKTDRFSSEEWKVMMNALKEWRR